MILVRKEHNAESAQHMVEGCVRKAEIFSISNFDSCFDSALARFRGRCSCHFISQINTDDIAHRSDCLGRRKEYGAPAARNIENIFAGFNAGCGDEALTKMRKAARPIVVVSGNGVEQRPHLHLPLNGISIHRRAPSYHLRLTSETQPYLAKTAAGRVLLAMSASLIGRFGSSAFRRSTNAVLMSLAGSCFSADSAPGPFHYGIRGRGGTIYCTVLPSDGRQVQATKRTHLIHRPARDIIPPRGGARVFSYRM